MRWLNLSTPGSRAIFLLERILLFSIILSFLFVFNLSFADDLTDPPPDSEHPWDDVCETGSDQTPEDPPEIHTGFMLHFGFDSWIMILLQSPEQKDDAVEGRAFAPTEKNRRGVLIFVR
ncbi:MAG: hypothetical protein WBC88_08250 [Candidatus Zixiibacteriota bacterium]